jgi:hypothetical protein
MRIKKGLGVLNPPFPSITPKTPREFKLSFHFKVNKCFARDSNSLAGYFILCSELKFFVDQEICNVQAPITYLLTFKNHSRRNPDIKEVNYLALIPQRRQQFF